MNLTIEQAVKVLEGISNHPSLSLNKAEHVLVENSLSLIKELIPSSEDKELKNEELKNEKITS